MQVMVRQGYVAYDKRENLFYPGTVLVVGTEIDEESFKEQRWKFEVVEKGKAIDSGENKMIVEPVEKKKNAK